MELLWLKVKVGVEGQRMGFLSNRYETISFAFAWDFNCKSGSLFIFLEVFWGVI